MFSFYEIFSLPTEKKNSLQFIVLVFDNRMSRSACAHSTNSGALEATTWHNPRPLQFIVLINWKSECVSELFGLWSILKSRSLKAYRQTNASFWLFLLLNALNLPCLLHSCWCYGRLLSIWNRLTPELKQAYPRKHNPPSQIGSFRPNES